MTKEEAYSEYRRQTDVLMFPRQIDDPASAPIMSLAFELDRIVHQLKAKTGAFRKDAYVERELEDPAMLVRALIAPSEIVWSEPTDETERDPVSGNPRPKMKRCHEAAPSKQGAFEIKERFLRTARALAAYAKHIASPAYAEWREIYIALETYFTRHNKLAPLDADFAEEIVGRFSRALFVLWADNEIAKEVRHV